MSLKYQTDTLDGLDPSIAALYAEKDGRYVLPVDGVVPSHDYEALNQRLVDANEENARRRRAVERWRELGESPEAVKEMLSGKPKVNEDNERIVTDIKNSYEGKLTEANKRISEMMQKNTMADLKNSLLQSNIVPQGVEPLALMAKQRIAFDETGNLRIMSADGSKPLAGSGSDGYATIGDLAKELAASDTGLLFAKDGGLSGGGKPPASQNGKPTNKTVSRTQFNIMSHRERATFAKDGGKVVDG